jgi:aspartate racemase
MKTIGILGGLGPQATIDFEQRLHRAAHRLTPQQGAIAYPPLVSWFFRELPVLLPADSPLPAELPPINPRLLEAARALGGHVDFLVIPSNGVHLWQAEIETAAGKPVVSMVDAVVTEVQRRGCRHVGLVDFRPAAWSVYPPRLAQHGLSWVELPSHYRDNLAGVMRAVNAGRNGDAEEAQLRLAISLLRAHHADGIILACTEFPLALTGELEPHLINPAELLAEAAVRAAIAHVQQTKETR